MIAIRSLLFFVFLLIYTPIYAVICMISFPLLNHRRRYQLALGWNHTVVKVCQWLCGISYELKGLEHLKAVQDEKVIILAKHQSAWETISFMTIFPRQLCFVFKRELLWIPFFCWTFGLLMMIHINRSDRSSASISVAAQGKEHLAAGNWIIIFPEGTRTAVGSAPAYRKGGARLASATQAWVLPVAHNAGHFWPRNSFFKYPGKITVSIGPAINSANKSADTLHQETQAWIESEMRIIDPHSYEK